MAAGDVYQLSLDQTVGQANLTNVFMYKQVVDGSDPALARQKLAEAFEGDVMDKFAQGLNAAWSAFCIRISRKSPTTSPELVVVPTTNNVGAKINQVLPPNQVGVVSFYTEEYSRKGRGRKYISGMDAADEAANNCTNIGLIVLQAIGDAVLADLSAVGDSGVYESGLLDFDGVTWRKFERMEARSPLKKLRGRTTKVCSAG